MPCPTCGYVVGVEFNDRLLKLSWFHCQRCGTLQIKQGEQEAVHVPKLVGLCQQYVSGIAESINVPENRT